MALDRVRHGRQIRLPEIGDAGQERLGACEVALGGRGDAREIETVYLRAAGVRVSEASVSGPTPKGLAPDVQAALLASLGVCDRAARDVADGALRALVAIRAIVGVDGG